ncbi:MAG: amidohydrolase family protein [Myxococcota bacterium]|mgnify:CR=1 FL=1|nr:hypothetical protein [Deltaproteobacteria bacterium]MCP4240061.1 amidohydrolase family protein [bacterium]MDP6076082.1 amidohydrolase family protein [Myxococcota bacterium]MDP6244034.1 amidohydrolase family protein [Myxococcota bacterium]MDP7073570.1 amidohydrolase family protein [Myxococcota bacterium]
MAFSASPLFDTDNLLRVMGKMRGLGRNGPWIGPERVLFGSDYPHAEGLAEPPDYAEARDGLSDDAIGQIMSDNMHRIARGEF